MFWSQWCHGMEAEPPGLLTFCPISASSQLSEKGTYEPKLPKFTSQTRNSSSSYFVLSGRHVLLVYLLPLFLTIERWCAINRLSITLCIFRTLRRFEDYFLLTSDAVEIVHCRYDFVGPYFVTGNVILAASFKSGNIQAFCYGGKSSPSQPTRSSLAPAMKPSDLDARLYSWQLPSKVFAPHAAPNNWTAVLRSPMNIFLQGMSTVFDLKREHIAGLVLLPEGISKDGQGRGFTLMQLTGEGDIMSQQFRAGEKQWNVGSHGSLVPTSNTATSGASHFPAISNTSKYYCCRDHQT